MNIEPLLKPAEAAEILRIKPEVLANWRCQGKGLKYVKYGDGQQARVNYRASDVAEYIENHMRAGPDDE